jgi:hypothetical protein
MVGCYVSKRVEVVFAKIFWNYSEVTDSFRLRHCNLLHCSLLVVRGAQITKR